MLFKKSYLNSHWFIGLVITLLFLAAAELGWFSELDRQAYNLGAEISAAKEPHEDIVIVAIDDKSLQKLGAWPWSRDVLAETTQLLTRVAPRVIGINLPFDSGQYQAGQSSLAQLRSILKKENKLSRNVNRALRQTEASLHSDDNLAKTFKKGGRIVLAMPYIATDKPTPGLTQSLPRYMQKFVLPNVHVSSTHPQGFGWPKPQVTRAETIFPPIEVLSRQVGAVG